MELWMRRKIPRPPEYTMIYTAQDRRSENFDVCVQSLLEGVLCGHAVLRDKEVSDCFQREAAILTASLFQNGRHRTEKFYKVLKKVKKCSERWRELNLSKILDDLRTMMPSITPTHRNIRMPSKQMFEYLLIRVLGGFHLLLGLDGYCREAAGYLMAKISSGHFFCTAMAFLANVARLRALALDLCGHLSKLYDDIFPWVRRLKGGSNPALILQESLPQTLSDYLQQYCNSLNVDSTPAVIKDARKDVQLSSILNIIMEEGDNSRTPSQSGESSGYKRGLEGAAESGVSSKQTKRSLTEEQQLDSRPPISAVSFEEDIGVCVDVKQKISKHFINVDNGSKRWKGSPKTGMEKVSECTERTKTSSDVKKNPTKAKRKRELEDSERTKKKKTKANDQCKPDLNGKSIVTPKFLRHYQSVNKAVKEINSVEALSSFLTSEKKRWFKKDCERVSRILKEDDWCLLRKLILTRLKRAKKLRTKVSTSDQNIEMEELLRKTKTRLKFWLLYPHLKGKKPENWENILLAIKNRKKTKATFNDNGSLIS